MPLLNFNKNGIYCPQADVYIDPWKKVPKALITHGHSDHARYGHQRYLCTNQAKPVIQHRLGKKMHVASMGFGEKLTIHGVDFSFHPAGHIVGSAQVRVAYKGEVWVVSGDYKITDDGLCKPFEAIPCHAFITESTFGLPNYKWEDQWETINAMKNWWIQNKGLKKLSIINAYSLGKAQRLLSQLDDGIGKIYCHDAVQDINEIIVAQGYPLPKTHRITPNLKSKDLEGALLITPSSALQKDELLSILPPYEIAVASGWMALRKMRKNRGGHRSFTLSDHADWDGLNTAIKATGAEKVFVTHGYTTAFSAWLQDQGYESSVVETKFEGAPIPDTTNQTKMDEEV